MKKITFCISFFLFASTILFAQVSRNTALYFKWGENRCSPSEVSLIQDSLVSKLATLEQVLITQVSLPNDEEQLVRYNKEAGYDSYLFFQFSGNLQSLTVNWCLYDSVFDKKVYEKTFSAVVDSDGTNLMGGFWIQTLKDVEQRLFGFSQTVPIRIQVLPFAKVYGLTSLFSCHQADENGMIEVELEAFKTFRISVKSPGYYTKQFSFVAVEQAEPYIFKLIKKYNINFEFNLSNITNLRFGIGYFVVPDTLFLGFSMTFNQFQLLVEGGDPSYNMGGEYAPSSLSLDFRLAGYIDASQSYLRFPIGIEYSLRFNTLKQIDSILDPYSLSTFTIPIGFEFFLHDNVLFFTEWTPRLYLTHYPELWQNTTYYKEFYMFPSQTVTPIIDLMGANIGLRFQI